MAQICFEGPEKKFEIILEDTSCALRQYGKAYWARLVELSGAQVLSVLSNARCDAYLLSESSLFVYDDQVIMITCGQTNLTKSLAALLKTIPCAKIHALFYERKNHFYPEAQPYDFSSDSRYIGKYLPVKEHLFGSTDTNHIHLLYYEKKKEVRGKDSTLEILMHGLDQRGAALFKKGVFKTRYDFYKATGINAVLPDFSVDDYFFEPVGYSVNAIKEDEYYTFHVTPETESSYASFETNHVFASSQELSATIKKVVSIFRPEAFDSLVYQNTAVSMVPDFFSGRYARMRENGYFFDSGYTVKFRTYLHEQSALNNSRG
jgi:S-adenosylmethionine decarboxylase